MHNANILLKKRMTNDSRECGSQERVWLVEERKQEEKGYVGRTG
jgi:hypothetical protein